MPKRSSPRKKTPGPVQGRKEKQPVKSPKKSESIGKSIVEDLRKEFARMLGNYFLLQTVAFIVILLLVAVFSQLDWSEVAWWVNIIKDGLGRNVLLIFLWSLTHAL